MVTFLSIKKFFIRCKKKGRNCKATAVERLSDANTKFRKAKAKRVTREKPKLQWSFANCRCFAGSKKVVKLQQHSELK